MNVIVTDSGFHRDDWAGGFAGPEALEGAAPLHAALDLANDADPDALAPHLDRIAMIRIRFPDFADGRGFTLAQRLRRLGFAGRLRAQGHVLADQYTMARRCGFDEVEISAELARRQPVEHWKFRGNWRAFDYQARLRA